MIEVYLDELTGCYNRRFLYHWLGHEIKRSKRYATKFALIFFDIDNFRAINNNFGHIEGDKVLIEFVHFLRSSVRDVDYVVRYGGDEFIILVPNAVEKGTVQFAHRILARLNRTDLLTHKIRCSIGYALFPDDGLTAEALVGHADNLMYQAKRFGKNRVGLKEQLVRKLQIPAPITIGRDDETGWCLDQLRDYNAIFVAGEAGVGKTRLVLETKKHLDNTFFLRANAYAALSADPYHPFKNMFAELLSSHFNLFQRVFRQLPLVYQAEVTKLMPTEDRLPSLTVDDLDKYRLYNAVTGFIIKTAQILSPNITLLLFDDVHWMDRQSCELFDFLLRSIKGYVKIFNTFRVEEIANSQIVKFMTMWSQEKFYTQINLSPLNENQTNELLKVIVGDVPAEVGHLIYEESGGNPFFVEEILRELDHQKKLFLDGKNWVFSENLDVTIPTSVEETIKRKLKFIEPEIRRFLDIMAVFGQEFSVDIIALASKMNIGETLHVFDKLKSLGFIKERAKDTYFFSEDIVRQVIYQNIPHVQLSEIHRLIGETIEYFYRNSLNVHLEQLARHFSVAREKQKALFYSKQAAEKVSRNYAHATAIYFFENALKYEEDAQEIYKIRFSIADTCFWTGEYERAIREFEHCLMINPKSGKVYEKLGQVYADIGDFKKCLKCYQKGLRLSKGTDTAHAFRLRIAQVYMRIGQFLRAKKECEDVLRLKRHMKKGDLGFAYLIYGVILVSIDRLHDAEFYLKKALKINRQIDDKNNIAACYQDLALCYLMQFNINKAEIFLNKAVEIDEKIGYLGGLVIARINLGALFSDYNLPKAEDYYQKGLETARLIGARRDIVLLLSNLGHIYHHRLMDDASLSNFQQALKLAKEIDYEEGVVVANLSLSEFYREDGEHALGRKYLKSAQRIAARFGSHSLLLSCQLEELGYLLILKDKKKLVRLLKKIDITSRRAKDLTIKIYGIISKARALDKLAKYGQARKYFQIAQNLVKALPPNRVAGDILYWQGITFKNQGNLKEAYTKFLQAYKIHELVGSLRDLENAQQELAKIQI